MVMRAKKEPAAALKLLSSRLPLTDKQRKLLSQSTPLKRVAAPSTALTNSNSAKQVIDYLVATGTITRPDIRASERYAELWRIAGMPPSWPRPFPYNTGPAGVYKFMYVDGQTGNSTVSVPAGEWCIVSNQYHAREGPVRFFLTTGAGTVGWPVTYAHDWSLAGSIQDQTVAWNNQCMWSGYIPSNFYENTDHLKTAPYYSNVPTTNDQPPRGQILGASTTITIQCPTNGMARCYVVDPSCTRHLTRASAFHEGGSALVTAGIRHNPNMCARFHHMTGIDTTSTAVAIAQEYGAATMVSSGETKTVCCEEAADDGWPFIGELDSTDAPALGTTSSYRNMWPRDRVPGSSFAAIYNSSSTAISVSAHGKAVYAMVLESDDANRSLSALQDMALKNAPTLPQRTRIEHLPDVTQSYHSTATIEERTSKAKDMLANHGLPPTITQHSKSIGEKITTTFHSAVDDVRSAFSWASQHLPGMAKAAASLVTEGKQAFNAASSAFGEVMAMV